MESEARLGRSLEFVAQQVQVQAISGGSLTPPAMGSTLPQPIHTSGSGQVLCSPFHPTLSLCTHEFLWFRRNAPVTTFHGRATKLILTAQTLTHVATTLRWTIRWSSWPLWWHLLPVISFRWWLMSKWRPWGDRFQYIQQFVNSWWKCTRLVWPSNHLCLVTMILIYKPFALDQNLQMWVPVDRSPFGLPVTFCGDTRLVPFAWPLIDLWLTLCFDRCHPYYERIKQWYYLILGKWSFSLSWQKDFNVSRRVLNLWIWFWVFLCTLVISRL